MSKYQFYAEVIAYNKGNTNLQNRLTKPNLTNQNMGNENKKGTKS